MSLLDIDKLESEKKQWDFVKCLVIEEIMNRVVDKNYSKVFWEYCDWPRILKRPERNIVYYLKYNNGDLYVRIKDRKKQSSVYTYGYRCLDKFISLIRMPISIEEILIKNGYGSTRY